MRAWWVWPVAYMGWRKNVYRFWRESRKEATTVRSIVEDNMNNIDNVRVTMGRKVA